MIIIYIDIVQIYCIHDHYAYYVILLALFNTVYEWVLATGW